VIEKVEGFYNRHQSKNTTTDNASFIIAIRKEHDITDKYNTAATNMIAK
jgi:hypothetical protein